MGIDVLRSQIIERIQNADESFLRILDAMTAAYEAEKKEVYEASLKPMTREEMTSEIEKSMAEYERGEYITLEESSKELLLHGR